MILILILIYAEETCRDGFKNETNKRIFFINTFGHENNIFIELEWLFCKGNGMFIPILKYVLMKVRYTSNC
jgi:hypothetical protein